MIWLAVLAGDVAVAIDVVGGAAIWRTDEEGFVFVALNGGIEFGSHFGAEAKLFWCEIRHRLGCVLGFDSEPALWLLALVQSERAVISELAYPKAGSGEGMNFRPPGGNAGGFVVEGWPVLSSKMLKAIAAQGISLAGLA